MRGDAEAHDRSAPAARAGADRRGRPGAPRRGAPGPDHRADEGREPRRRRASHHHLAEGPAGDGPGPPRRPAHRRGPRGPGSRVHFTVPEGWAKSPSGRGHDVHRQVQQRQRPGPAPRERPTLASVRAHEVPQLQELRAAIRSGTVDDGSRQHGRAVHILYRLDSAPNPVTDKVVRDVAERFNFWHAGQEGSPPSPAPACRQRGPVEHRQRLLAMAVSDPSLHADERLPVLPRRRRGDPGRARRVARARPRRGGRALGALRARASPRCWPASPAPTSRPAASSGCAGPASADAPRRHAPPSVAAHRHDVPVRQPLRPPDRGRQPATRPAHRPGPGQPRRPAGPPRARQPGERLAARSCPGGELVRAVLAVALVNAPDVLLADEPTGKLDEATESRLLALSGSGLSGCAVLVASHSPAVRRAADRVLILEDGRLVA